MQIPDNNPANKTACVVVQTKWREQFDNEMSYVMPVVTLWQGTDVACKAGLLTPVVFMGQTALRPLFGAN